MKGNPNRILAIILAAVAVLVVVAATVAALRPVPVLDPNSPEGVVQQYLEAVLADDGETAASLLAPGLGCEADDFAGRWFDDDVRIALVDTNSDGSDATVEVEISYGGNDLFESDYIETETFRLTRENSEWLVSGQPWPVYFCGGGG